MVKAEDELTTVLCGENFFSQRVETISKMVVACRQATRSGTALRLAVSAEL
jgi:hypothetical protein